MQTLNSLKSNVFQINNRNFERAAIDLFHFQYNNNTIYHEYIKHLPISVEEINSVTKIPFLPIRFFKSQKIQSGNFKYEKVFVSSGTTGFASKHYIEDLSFYEQISSHIFQTFFGSIKNSIVIGLLPSYFERINSSLIHMVNNFIKQSGNDKSGFYLNDLEDLVIKIRSVSDSKIPVYLFGVTFALLELADKFNIDAQNLVVLETGGMKGRGKEMIREEVHQHLKASFNTDHIFSEYGMTELLSQAYLKKDMLFHTPPWMRVLIREIHDPFEYCLSGNTGVINVIDLANVHSCAFIETEDLGVKYENGFRVLGRVDNSDLRGCNLLLT